jgi:hypothetical protein
MRQEDEAQAALRRQMRQDAVDRAIGGIQSGIVTIET